MINRFYQASEDWNYNTVETEPMEVCDLSTLFQKVSKTDSRCQTIEKSVQKMVKSSLSHLGVFLNYLCYVTPKLSGVRNHFN